MEHRIVVRREPLLAGEPCWDVDGEMLAGFDCQGVITVRAEGGQTWIEWSGDEEDFEPGGWQLPPAEPTFTRGWNLWYAGALTPVDELGQVVLAVNRPRAVAGKTAVTAYSRQGSMLVPSATVIGRVWTATVVPAAPRPLCAWLVGAGALRVD